MSLAVREHAKANGKEAIVTPDGLRSVAVGGATRQDCGRDGYYQTYLFKHFRHKSTNSKSMVINGGITPQEYIVLPEEKWVLSVYKIHVHLVGTQLAFDVTGEGNRFGPNSVLSTGFEWEVYQNGEMFEWAGANNGRVRRVIDFCMLGFTRDGESDWYGASNDWARYSLDLPQPLELWPNRDDKLLIRVNDNVTGIGWIAHETIVTGTRERYVPCR